MLEVIASLLGRVLNGVVESEVGDVWLLSKVEVSLEALLEEEVGDELVVVEDA